MRSAISTRNWFAGARNSAWGWPRRTMCIFSSADTTRRTMSWSASARARWCRTNGVFAIRPSFTSRVRRKWPKFFPRCPKLCRTRRASRSAATSAWSSASCVFPFFTRRKASRARLTFATFARRGFAAVTGRTRPASCTSASITSSASSNDSVSPAISSLSGTSSALPKSAASRSDRAADPLQAAWWPTCSVLRTSTPSVTD